MSKWFFVVFLAFILVSPVLLAEPVTQDMVLDVARTQLAAQTPVDRVSAGSCQGAICGVREFRAEDTGELLAYIIDLSPKGYLVVSTDTDICPVIAYSYTSNFVMEDIEENTLYHLVNYDMKKRIELLATTCTEIKAGNQDLWQEYAAGSSAFIAGLSAGTQWPSDRDGWLTARTWAQTSPYNNDCPIDPSTDIRSVTGCGATALAQICNYWQKPTSIIFDDSWDYITDANKISIQASSANISSIDYNSGDPSNAVLAALSYACGVAQQMDYGSSGSYSYLWTVEDALAHFGYAGGSWYFETPTTFYTRLKSNMQNGRPAEVHIAQGPTYANGHAVVFDGYNDVTGYYHINYGWGGSTDGWYNVPDEMGASYDIIYGAVLDIYPGNATNVVYRDGGHDFKGSTTAAQTWYLAEGYTGGTFDTWVCVQNPNDDTADLTVTFMTPSGSSVITDTVSGNSRKTFSADFYVPNSDVSTKVETTHATGVVAERAMYWDSYLGGHDSMGVTTPATTWYLAEGFTGTDSYGNDFQTWVSVMNPSGTDANVTATYMKSDGTTAQATLVVEPERRGTLSVDATIPDDSVSIQIDSDVAVVAERPVYLINAGDRIIVVMIVSELPQQQLPGIWLKVIPEPVLKHGFLL